VSRTPGLRIVNAAQVGAASDADLWQNPYGGIWGTASNWWDNTTGTTAATAPGALNPVAITGGTAGNFTDIVGTGAAGQLAITNDVLLWGTLAVGGTVTVNASSDFDLDGAATLSAASLSLADGAELLPGGGSDVTVNGAASLTADFLSVINGSTMQVGTLLANSLNTGFALASNTIAVDDNSVLEVGSAGGAAPGAITIDPGQTATVSGTLDGNIIVNGALAVQAGGVLTIDAGDPFGSGQTIAGTGTLTLSENSLLTLGVADGAAIDFGAPGGILGLDVLPTGTIAGFAPGDFIELVGGATVMATGLSYSQTSNSLATLNLTKGGRAVGSLSLAGNFAADLFHLGLDIHGDAIISLQSVGSAPPQPAQITGTAGNDTLVATANNQILTGLGGSDVLSAAGFTGIDFKDSSADLNGGTITAFGTTDLIDLTDMNPASATVSYTPGSPAATLVVTDGSHSATISLALATALAPGFFTTATDGAGGTDVRYSAANTDAFTFAATPGGNFGTAANWQDTTTGTVAAQGPSYGNAVTLAGGPAYIDVTGNGVAASVISTGDILMWGSVVAGSKLAGVSGALTQTGTLALDGAACLTLIGTAAVGGLLEVAGASKLTAAALMFTTNAASLLAIGGSTVQVPALIPTGLSQYDTAVIDVDPSSSVEIGTAGSAAAGALTIDHGVTADFAGTIGGNLIVNGTLIAVGTLTVAPFGATVPSVSGSGTIDLTYGDALSLAGPDSAAIQFSQTAAGSYGSTAETLALGTIMPTATISGLVKGDVITVGLIVTNLSWNGATLKLLDGGTTVGTLTLSGLFSANQFQVQLAPNGLSSIITCTATPSTAGGNSVNGNTDSYTWNSPNGGVWSNASQWIDTTAGGTATAAPGATDAVTINDSPNATTAQIIYGPAATATLTIAAGANTILIGMFSVTGQFSVAQYGLAASDTALYGSTNLTAGSLNVTSTFRVTNASVLTVLGSTGGTFISGAMTVGGDSAVTVDSGSTDITGLLSVDGSSSMEFGNAGTAASGTLTIDYGQDPILQGNAELQANLVVNGGLLVYSGLIEGFGGAAGTIGGTGTITIAALGSSGSLILNATETAPIQFQLYSLNGTPYAFESLELRGPLRTGVISGFIAGDTIIIDQHVTGVTFTQTTNSQGTLTLTNGATTIGALTLNGNFAGDLFQADVAAQTGVTTISLQSLPTATGSAAASTGSHSYDWTGASGGSWTNASNWLDATTGTTPTTVPGSANVVLIAGTIGAGRYTTIGGNGAGAALTIIGSVLLTGQVNVAGSVILSNGSGPAADLTLAAGASLTAGASVEIFGRLEAGGGSAATLPGYALLYNGSLLALDGSTVQAGGLIGDGAGDVLAVDANSVIKIGAATSATAGALTISAGAPAQFTGLIYGSVVSNGIFYVQGGGTLLIDMTATSELDPYGTNPTISGSGYLMLTEGSTLGLGVVDSAAINFYGPNATLLLAALPTAAISGFTAGDQIVIDQAVTGLKYVQTTAGLATLTLTDGASTVGSLKLIGNFAGAYAFHLDAAPNGDNAVITLQALQVALSQPTMIYGTVGTDDLIATANGQTISGEGGGDILSGGAYTGIHFKDYSFYLSGSAIQDFAPSDIIDFIDVNPLTATQTFSGGMLSISDGTHAATLSLSFGTPPASGSFHIASDGAGGSKLTWS